MLKFVGIRLTGLTRLTKLTGLIGFVFSLSVKAQMISRHSLLITEIFADPVPSVGLPGTEFIELTNVSDSTINLLNWKIGDGGSIARITTSFLLKPDSMVVICPASSVISWEPFGAVIGLSSFPSLNNDADLVVLYSAEGSLIHAISYQTDWYRNEVKSQGGWTLELIDKQNPCGGKGNWIASKDPRGGSPGQINSNNASNPDEDIPELIRSWYVDSASLIALFNEPMDSSIASSLSNYQFNPKLEIESIIALSPLFNEILIRLKEKPDSNLVYELSVRFVTDCAGNAIGGFNKVKFAQPRLPLKNEIVINEILFNPKPDGFDYVEFYNSGKKTIDLSRLYIASRNSNGDLINLVKVATEPFLVFPGEWIAITENRNWVLNNYFVKQPTHLLQIQDLPSLPDDNGKLVLLNEQGTFLDELHYDEKWHFALIGNREAVALEKIDYSKPTQDKNNWTSASSTSGFGTPTAMNSQFLSDPQLQGAITVSPKVFSPDNDGFDDFATINYQLNEPGYVVNITIFDLNGRPVRYLVKNSTLSQQGKFFWDGLNDKQQQLPIGMYVLYAEVFNLNGRKARFKNTITLARKL